MKKTALVLVLCVVLSPFSLVSSQAPGAGGFDSAETESVDGEYEDADEGEYDGEYEDEYDGEYEDEDDAEYEDAADEEYAEDDDSDEDSAASAMLSADEIAGVVSFMNDVYDSTERFLSDLDGADSAASVAAAINSYAQEMESFKARAQSMAETLSSPAVDGANMPEEIRAAMERMNGLSSRMNALTPKMQQYSADQEVMEALQKLNEITS